ncbi:MAG: mechanosensitive ion channel family protein [Anaerolineae bacterium]
MDPLTEFFAEDNLLQLGLFLATLVAAVIAAQIVLLFVDRVFVRFTGRTRTQLDDKLIQALRRPVFLIIVLIGIQLAIAHLRFLNPDLVTGLRGLLSILTILVGAYLIYRILLGLLEWYAESIAVRTETHFDEQIVPFVKRLVQIALLAVVGIMILDQIGVEVGALVAGLGVGSLAIALAAQAILGDTIAGFAIMVDRPFTEGDRILLPKRAGGTYGRWGDVVEIGLRITKVRSTDGLLLTIPNALLTKDVIVNFSHLQSPALRVRIRIGLESDWENVKRAMDLVSEILEAHPDVSKEPRPPQVVLRELRDYDVLVEARYYVDSARKMRTTNSDALSQILQRFEKEGVRMSTPAQVVQLQGSESQA